MRNLLLAVATALLFFCGAMEVLSHVQEVSDRRAAFAGNPGLTVATCPCGPLSSVGSLSRKRWRALPREPELVARAAQRFGL